MDTDISDIEFYHEIWSLMWFGSVQKIPMVMWLSTVVSTVEKIITKIKKKVLYSETIKLHQRT